MSIEFKDVITSEEQLRNLIGNPASSNVQKVIPILDEHSQEFIRISPFVALATADRNGNMDVSPKGDAPGFVQILDQTTLAIPDRPGNRRADSLSNIIQNPIVSLLFFIPGKRETLRVRGRAQIVRDDWLREKMAVKGKPPALAIVVKVEAVFFHCAKCIIRSHLWDTEHWPNFEHLASLAQVLIDHANLGIDLDEYEKGIEENYRDDLY